MRAGGDTAWWGWPNSPECEALRNEWFAAPDLAAEKAVMARYNKALMDFAIYNPTGFFLAYQAWRKNVSGVVKGPLPFFWGVSKS